MSVSFLVEASDVPVGAKPIVSTIAEPYGPQLPTAFEVDFEDVDDGLASWYGQGFHGRRTASGRTFDMNELTAAHRTLPFGTLLRVNNSVSGQSVLVEVTDRGPFIKKRVVDLSKAAARMIGVSVTPVDLYAITPGYMREFYVDNDSTVLVITPDMSLQVRPRNSIGELSQPLSFSKAMTNLNADSIVVVGVNDRGALHYSRAKSTPVVLAGSAL